MYGSQTSCVVFLNLLLVIVFGVRMIIFSIYTVSYSPNSFKHVFFSHTSSSLTNPHLPQIMHSEGSGSIIFSKMYSRASDLSLKLPSFTISNSFSLFAFDNMALYFRIGCWDALPCLLLCLNRAAKCRDQVFPAPRLLLPWDLTRLRTMTNPDFRNSILDAFFDFPGHGSY